MRSLDLGTPDLPAIRVARSRSGGSREGREGVLVRRVDDCTGRTGTEAAGVTVPPDSVFISTYVGPSWLSAKVIAVVAVTGLSSVSLATVGVCGSSDERRSGNWSHCRRHVDHHPAVLGPSRIISQDQPSAISRGPHRNVVLVTGVGRHE